jgi:hypothetical protein
MVGGLFGRMPQARYAELTGAATHPAGARPSKCIIIIMNLVRLLTRKAPIWRHCGLELEGNGMKASILSSVRQARSFHAEERPGDIHPMSKKVKGREKGWKNSHFVFFRRLLLVGAARQR